MVTLYFIFLNLLLIAKFFVFFILIYVLASISVSLWGKQIVKKNKTKNLHQGQTHNRQLYTEICQSILTCLVYSLSGYLIILAINAGFYSATIGKWNAKELLLLPIVLLFYDAYTYWTHRALHTKYLFAFHREHHLSVETTAWSALRLTWIENLVPSFFFHFMAWATPFHFNSLIVFYVVISVLSTIAHAGVELYGLAINKNSRFNFWNSVAFHDLHHRSPQINFGAYFGFWDILCGTNKLDSNSVPPPPTA